MQAHLQVQVLLMALCCSVLFCVAPVSLPLWLGQHNSACSTSAEPRKVLLMSDLYTGPTHTHQADMTAAHCSQQDSRQAN